MADLSQASVSPESSDDEVEEIQKLIQSKTLLEEATWQKSMRCSLAWIVLSRVKLARNMVPISMIE